METRAHHFIIGAFTAGISALLVIFAIWLGRYEFDVRYQVFEIVFQGGVTGLDKGADVRYSGIKVGQVTDVRLDPTNPDNVRILVRVNATTPVNEDSKASLETGILTGLSVVQLTGGSDYAKPLQRQPGQEYPVIPSEKTGIQELFAGAPELIAQGNRLLAGFNQLVNQENIGFVSGVLNDVKTLTSTLAASSENIDNVLKNADQITTDVAKASQRLDEIAANIEDLTGSANAIVEKDAREVLAEAKEAVSNLKRLADQAEALVRENRPALRDFARGGLPQLVLFIQEARELFSSLDRLSRKIESDPGAFIFGTGAPTYSPSGQPSAPR